MIDSNEQFLKIYFTDSPDTKYFKEISAFDSPYDCINTLVQGYVRCLNCLRSGWFGGIDTEYVELMREFMMAVLRTYFRVMEHGLSKGVTFGGTNFLHIIYDFESRLPTEERVVTRLLEQYQELSEKNLVAGDVNVLFQLLYGNRGPAMMYHLSPRMNSFIQVHAYFILFKHVIDRLPLAHVPLFTYYMGSILGLINEKKASFESPEAMIDLIKRASLLALQVAQAKRDPNLLEFATHLPK